MSIRFLKDIIGGIHVPQFKLAYICDTNNPLRKNLVKICWYVHYIWWGFQCLEVQE